MTCVLGRGVEGDPKLGRLQVWEDDLWRLTTTLHPTEVVRGFSYLEPKRHVPDITALAGEEAATFGRVIATVTAAMKVATGADLVDLYVFGGHIDHLHLHLAPLTEGDPLSDAMIRGALVEEPLPSGGVAMVSKDFPTVPEEQLRSTARAIGGRLASG